MARRRAEWLPSESNELLLRAAIGGRDESLEAWERWKSEEGLENFDFPGLQLLPSVWRNLSLLHPDAPQLDRLKGTYRYVWVKNQVLLRFGADLIRTLRAAGIQTMVLKGTALSLLHYRDLGVRLMADIDVLVPRGSALNAVELLRDELGRDNGFGPPERQVLFHHATVFTEGPDREVDLHWYSLWQASPDRALWEASVPVEIEGEATRAPCPADLLLLTCAHGATWHPNPMVRWVLDSMVILRGDQAVDWDRLVTQARIRELGLIAADALGYLRESFGADVPAEVLASLAHGDARWSERVGRWGARHPRSAVGTLGMHWERYRRLKRNDPSSVPPSFGAYLRVSRDYGSYRDLARDGLRRVFRGRHDGGSGPSPRSASAAYPVGRGEET